ncbi:MAG: alkaline phosphatase [bacterium]|nr:alkaline phosphatase [bacterium]
MNKEDKRVLAPFSRREFLWTSAAMVGAGLSAGLSAGCAGTLAAERDKRDKRDGITVGIFTDPHYANRDNRGKRYYRDSSAKLGEFVAKMNKLKPDFAIVLGDYIDKGSTLQAEKAYLKHIEGVYSKFKGPCHHVIGNHDVATFTKAQFVDGVGMPAPNYSFDSGPIHCIVLDANYRKDFTHYNAGNYNWTQAYVPPDEQKWLKDDLKKTTRKTIVFIHQPLDCEKTAHGVKNSPEVRKILEQSGKVLAVFQGHNHSGGYQHINGIHYSTMRAMVVGPGLKNNSYALARISPKEVKVEGFVKQPAYPPKAPPKKVPS